MIEKYLIYGLVDPFTAELRYIGRSSSGFKRPVRHWKDQESRGHTHCARWVRKVVSGGKLPEIIVIERFEFSDTINEELNEAEIFWISYFRGIGTRLTNMTIGGEGNINPSKETREKISKVHLGRKHTLESRAKMSVALRGKKFSKERCERMSQRNKGKVLSEDTKKKISAALKGKKRSEEVCKKISVGRIGMRFSVEHSANMSKVRIGKKVTDETKRKISNTLSGRIASEAHKKNLSVSGKNRKYTPEGLMKIKAAAILREKKKKQQQSNKNGLL